MKFQLSIALSFIAVIHSSAQGTVHFANFVTTSEGATLVDAPVFALGAHFRAFGSDYLVQLYAAPSASPSNDVKPVGSPATFQTGSMAGYWIPSTAVVPNVLPGEHATLQMRAWRAFEASSFEEAFARGTPRGVSNILTLPLGGNGLPPVDLIGLQAFMIIPEPSGVWLLALGGFALALRAMLLYGFSASRSSCSRRHSSPSS